MKLGFFMAAPILAFISLAACSSNSTNGTTYCSDVNTAIDSCYIYKDLTPQQESDLNSACLGAVVSSCPTANMLGCCTSSLGGLTAEECYYAQDGGFTQSASQLQSSCTSQSGSWSTAQ
jgi:hypothetical protein